MKIIVPLLVSALIFTACASSEKKAEMNQREKNRKLLEENTVSREKPESSAMGNAKQLLVEGKFQEVLDLLKEKEDEDALFYRAMAYYSLEQFDKAEPLFIKALEKGQFVDESAYNLGLIFHEKGNDDKAVAHMEKVLQVNAKHPGASYFLGSFWYGKEDYTKALDYYKVTVETQPDNSAGWESLFYTYLSLNDAQAAWDLRGKLSNNDQRITYNLLLLAEKLGKYTEGVELGAGDAEKNQAARKQMIVLYARLGNLDKALKLSQDMEISAGRFLVLDRHTTEKYNYLFFQKEGGDLFAACQTQKGAFEIPVKYEGGKITLAEEKKEFTNYGEFIKNLDIICVYH